MPRGDGTGPQGLGPMTGRAAGYCAGYPTPGCMNPYGGRGLGRGGFGRGGSARGGGRGVRRNWYYATGLPGWARANAGLPAWGGTAYPYSPEFTPKQEADMLKEQANAMQDEIKSINKRIEELESAKKQ